MMIFASENVLFLIAALSFWILPWKGYALWLAARRKDKWWFIILLVINTLAIIEIIYIFFIAKRTDQKEVLQTTAPGPEIQR